MKVANAQNKILILNGLMREISPADIPNGLFHRYCKAVDDINDTEEDYVPTKAQTQAVVGLQAEVRQVIKRLLVSPL